MSLPRRQEFRCIICLHYLIFLKTKANKYFIHLDPRLRGDDNDIENILALITYHPCLRGNGVKYKVVIKDIDYSFVPAEEQSMYPVRMLFYNLDTSLYFYRFYDAHLLGKHIP